MEENIMQRAQKPKAKAAKVLSFLDMVDRFPDEEAAIMYLKDVLWPEGPVCPFCGSKHHNVRANPMYLYCADCRKSYTIRTGTIFQRSHVPLHKWLYAIYLVVTARKGVSSLQLSKELGITQKSAWFMLQRIRSACGNDGGCDLLSGIVEVDETYIGGKEANRHESKKKRAGRGPVGKMGVIGMKQRDGKVKAEPLPNTSAKAVHAAVTGVVAPGTILCTDDHVSYRGMPQYNRKVVNHSAKQYVDGLAHTNSIESVWAVLKRGFYGTFHWFTEKHLGRYVDEFTFRLNEGNCRYDTITRIDSFLCKVPGTRLTYKSLTA
jgi:transposase-like protein